MPDISVIIPVYNTGTLLCETVNSVLGQSFSDFELILVDDGSKQETKEIINSFTDSRIKIIFKENGGVASARNTGLAAAKGTYIALLDHDDLWHKDKLSRQKSMLDKDNDAVLVYSPIECFGSSDTISIPNYECVNGNAFLSELQQNKIHSTSCVMFRRDIVTENKIFFSSKTVPCDDWHFYLQLSQYGKFLCASGVPVYYRLHSGNQSSDVSKMYKAGIRVLEIISKEINEISERTKIPAKTISLNLNLHLAKHWRGLAFCACKKHDYKNAAIMLKHELKCRFSLKATLMYAVFSLLKLATLFK